MAAVHVAHIDLHELSTPVFLDCEVTEVTVGVLDGSGHPTARSVRHRDIVWITHVVRLALGCQHVDVDEVARDNAVQPDRITDSKIAAAHRRDRYPIVVVAMIESNAIAIAFARDHADTTLC